MKFNRSNRKTIIMYMAVIAFTAVFAIAYFSSYATVKRTDYISEFEMLPANLQESDSRFRLVDISDVVGSSAEKIEEEVITPLGIGKIPSLPDTDSGEIKMYNVLQNNDGPISEAEKDNLTEDIHWREYITGPDDTISSVAKEFNANPADVRKANCFSENTETVKEGTLLFIPDSDWDIEITRNYVQKIRAEAERIVMEKNKMHPLAYVIQRGDTAAKIARRFGIKAETLMSANAGKRFAAGNTLTIPTMNGIYVRAQKKDTVTSIARRYGSSAASIMRANGIKGNSLRAGIKIFVPGGRQPETYMLSSGSRSGSRFAGRILPETGGSIGHFRWPCHGRVTSSYGYRRSPFRRRRSVFHAGIDIGAPRGTPVVASASGVVSHAGWMSGYGKTVIIQHGGGVSTLYGHNSSLLVGVGRTVSRGQIIARVGSTGRSTGNHCHFEIRRGGRPTNPMRGLR